MDRLHSLFGDQEKRILEAKADADRVLCKQLIDQYNKTIKQHILDLYAAKGARISRLIDITRSIPHCLNLVALQALKSEAADIGTECDEYCSQTLKDRQLCIFNNYNDKRMITFPRDWEIDVVQEWCDYWQSGMLFGESKRSKERDRMSLQEIIEQTKTPQVQVIANWCEFKSREIHVDIWKTVTECRAWCERYDLCHLDVLCSYTQKK